MRRYKCLAYQKVVSGIHELIPLRDEDKYLIMDWRNEQIYHLRQTEILIAAKQEAYFKNTVNRLFKETSPEQLLFSFLENGVCVGYGGLVHINWLDKHAEISFIMNTRYEKDRFELYWIAFLRLLEKIAFAELRLHKIFTYAFDLRPQLYTALQKAGYTMEARLKEHALYDGKFIDVVIHVKLENECEEDPALPMIQLYKE